MNILTVSGRIGQAAEVRILKEEKKVANFSLAIQREFKNKEGKYDTDWFDCVYIGVPDFAIPRLEKGARILINGHIRKDNYEKDGIKKSVAKIYVQRIEFLDKKEVVNTGEPKEELFEKGSQDIKDDEVPF